MNMQKLNGIPYAVAFLALVALVAAACTIPLRSDEDHAKVLESGDATPDPLAAKLAECRSVTYEQKDALIECRKAWAEKRHQFLGQKAPKASDIGMPRAGSSLFVTPKDESRLPSGLPSIQQNGTE
ncbi:MAG: putative entry exclusion protein TrbK-alt [Bradyrhizobium sp.]|uniref:putative entry exclusion protein TrbK-alt n=1 Tax=Bradyrhizobium sp. TaxID=376 RepID=UPI0029B7269B|nr:putative entry exclusion protein TrbK-alt [Bradyrhizobium sp.]MDX3969246.1 putative entry exclusion protein TrbK-alt [Bradyrhizobium sp.]